MYFDRFLIQKNFSQEEKDFLKEIKKIQKESTLAIGLLINIICRSIKQKTYLNIGCLYGFSLFSGMIKTDCEVIGIDNFSQEDSTGKIKNIKQSLFNNFEKLSNINHKFYENDYKLILENLREENKKISFYYYDAGHSYEDHRDNLLIAKDILVDDICRKEVYEGALDGLSIFKNYKILDHVKTIHPRHPTFWNGYF